MSYIAELMIANITEAENMIDDFKSWCEAQGYPFDGTSFEMFIYDYDPN